MKRKHLSRGMAAVLVAAMALTLAPVSAFADPAEDVEVTSTVAESDTEQAETEETVSQAETEETSDDLELAVSPDAVTGSLTIGSVTYNWSTVKADGYVQIPGYNVYYQTDGEELTGYIYGQKDMTFAEFYGDEVSADYGKFDTVSTGTVQKSSMFPNELTTIGDSSYTIDGVKDVNVAVDAQTYAQTMMVAAANRMAGSGTMADYYAEVQDVRLNEDPTAPVTQYKTIAYDGTLSTTLNIVDVVNDADCEVQTSSNWGDYLFVLTENTSKHLRNARTDDFDVNSYIQGAILTFTDGTTIGARFMNEIWIQSYEIAMDSVVAGKTLSSITYLMPDTAYVYSFADGVACKEAKYDLSVSFKDAKNGSCSEIAITGVPEDIENPVASVYYLEGAGRMAKKVYVAENAEITDGVIALTTPAVAGKEYTVMITSDNYSDTSAKVSMSLTSYADLYAGLGVDTSSDYDAVTSATGISSYHSKDIPSVVDKATDADGNVSLDGVVLDPEAGTDKAAAIASSSYTTSRYGKGEFAIIMDASQDGFSFDEYQPNMYAATISNGETTVGALHWVDLYAEPDTSSAAHGNKIEIAINNGTSVASNAAEVNRFAAFMDENGNMAAGTYTITIYAQGYQTVSTEVTVPATYVGDVVAEANADETAVSVAGLPEDIQNALVTVSYTVGAGRGAKTTYAAQNVALGEDGTIALTDALVDDVTYTVTINSDNYMPVTTTLLRGTFEIKTQPESVYTKVGKTAAFSVVANRAASYQWQYQKTADGKWYDLKETTGTNAATGTATADLSMKVTKTRMSYNYRCAVTGDDGSVIYTDTVNMLSGAVEITTQPESCSVKKGAKVTLNVVANNAVSYQWQYQKTADGKWCNLTDKETASQLLSGTTTDTLTLKATATRLGFSYRCKMVGIDGVAVYSDVVTIQ